MFGSFKGQARKKKNSRKGEVHHKSKKFDSLKDQAKVITLLNRKVHYKSAKFYSLKDPEKNAYTKTKGTF